MVVIVSPAQFPCAHGIVCTSGGGTLAVPTVSMRFVTHVHYTRCGEAHVL